VCDPPAATLPTAKTPARRDVAAAVAEIANGKIFSNPVFPELPDDDVVKDG